MDEITVSILVELKSQYAIDEGQCWCDECDKWHCAAPVLALQQHL